MTSLLVRNVHVLDIDHGEFLPDTSLLAVDGIVVDVDPAAEAPAGCVIVDGRGRYAIPGLIDAHVHLYAGTADLHELSTWPPSYGTARAHQVMRAMLANGFTTVRDTGGADSGLARSQDEGLVPGPRIYFGGKGISPTGGHGDFRAGSVYQVDTHPCCSGLGQIADGVDAMRRTVRDELRRGAHHIKIMASGGIASPTDRMDSLQYSEDEITAAVQEATAANRYVAAHAYTAAAINRALRLGVRSIEHGNYLDAESVRLFTAHDAYVVPTLVTYRDLVARGRAAGLTQQSWEKAHGVYEAGLGALELAVAGGVKVAFGTDLLGDMHSSQLDELTIRATIQDPLSVLRSATTVAAQLLNDERLGSLRVGAFADALLIEDNPLDDIAHLVTPSTRVVIQNGKVVVGRVDE